MKIVFTDSCKDDCQTFQVTEGQIRRTIKNPDESQLLKFDDLDLRFFIKKLSKAKIEFYLLSCTRWQNGNLTVQSVFKILPEIVEEVKTLEPLILLQQLALKFGLTIRVGQQFNKFIFRESIRIEPSYNSTQVLVEVLNPENHSFVQSMYFKIEQKNVTAIAHCALVYCIDTDRYLSWSKGNETVVNIIAYIAPNLKGHITPRDLIEASGTLSFRFIPSQLDDKQGILFKVASPGYFLEVGFTKLNFYIARNKQRIEMPIEQQKPCSGMYFYATWQPTELGLLILDKPYDKIISRNKALTEEKWKKTLETTPTFPPNSLINWARSEAIAPTTNYDSLSHFYQEVTSALQSIQDKIATVSMYNAFWDITYKGARIIKRKPKREQDILPTVYGLLFDIATAKNFQVAPEHQIGGGRLDFLISGYLKTGIANVCVEFKHAHSPNLKDGLLKQLPTYMKTKGCDFGLYCAMFFKGPHFKEPKTYNLSSIKLFLDRLKNSAGLSNIRTLIFDLSHSKPPSQL